MYIHRCLMYLVRCPGQLITWAGDTAPTSRFLLSVGATCISLSRGCRCPATPTIPMLPSPPWANTDTCLAPRSTSSETSLQAMGNRFLPVWHSGSSHLPVADGAGDQRAVEQHHGLHVGLPCDALSSCGLLSCSKVSNLAREICWISPYFSRCSHFM